MPLKSSAQTWRNRQEATWLLLALLTPLIVNLWVEQQFEASKVWLLRTLIWALAWFCLADWLAGGRSTPLPSTIRELMLALLIVGALATALSPYPWLALVGSLERAGGFITQASYVLLFACVATRIDGPQSQRLLTALVITAVPIVALGLAQAAGWQPLPLLTDARSPLTTTLGRANFTGAYLALMLPLTLTAASESGDRRRRGGYAVLAALELVVIGLTLARASWIAAVVGVAVLLWLRRAPGWTARRRGLSVIVGILGLGGLLLLILERGIAGGGSLAARWTIWQASLRLLWPRLWLGYGADTLELIFPAVYPPQLVYYQGRGVVVDRAHNWLLDGSLSYGVVGVFILGALMFVVCWRGWGKLTNAEDRAALAFGEKDLGRPWIAACLAAVSAHLVGNLFLFEVAATAVVFWLLLALLTAATAARDVGHVAVPLASQRARLALKAGALVILVGLIWQANARPLLADRHSWRATRALAEGDAQEALAEYSAAVAFEPRRAAYHVALALTAAQLGGFARAEGAMFAAIAQRPADPALYAHLAAIYAREAQDRPERLPLAFTAYERAIALAPTLALTYQQYADLALRTGDWGTAAALATRAVELDATDGLSYAILGWAHLEAGDLPAASKAFLNANRWRETADARVGLATVYLQQGHIDAARSEVARSLAIDPGFAPAVALQLQLQSDACCSGSIPLQEQK